MGIEPSWLLDTASKYEELRALIDGGSESMTHADALNAVRYWRDVTAERDALRALLREAREILYPPMTTKMAGLVDRIDAALRSE